MPILDLQQRDRELGRLRIGQKADGGKRPEKLDKFRFTSADRDLIEAVAKLYGGTAAPWNNDGNSEFEVFTEADRLPIWLPPEPITQWYELWSGGGCQRRCDGRVNILSDTRCACPADPLDRAQAAAKGRACKPTTRLNVVLADVPDVGVWRLESHGYHSAVELPRVSLFLAQAAQQGVYVPAVLGLSKRTKKRPGEPRKSWITPFIKIEATPRALMAGEVSGTAAVERPQRAALTAGGEVPDYQALIDTADSVEQVRALWKQAKNAGDLTPGLEAAMAERSAELTPETTPSAAVDAEPVDAELVNEDETAEDRLWFAAMENSPEGWTDARLRQEFAARNGNMSPDAASEEQLGAFLQWLMNGAGQ